MTQQVSLPGRFCVLMPGVEHVGAVVDFIEGADGLLIRRRGGGPLMHVARESLIRFESALLERLEVISVDLPPRSD